MSGIPIQGYAAHLNVELTEELDYYFFLLLIKSAKSLPTAMISLA